MTPAVASPRTLNDALRALDDAGPQARVLAGGTDLMAELASGRSVPASVVDVWRVDELRGIAAEGGGLRLGALTTCAELMRSPLARERADLLVAAAGECGASQIQNRATLGGNLGTASPAADLVPALMALGASVRLVSRAGKRDVSVADAITGYRATVRRPDELFHSFHVPERSANEHRAFRKVGTRAAQSISKVVVAMAVVVTEGRIERARAAAGAVAPRTLLLPTLARELAGRAPSAEAFARAAALAARDDVAPIDDLRSTAAYRRLVLRNLLRTMLAELATAR